MSSPTGTASVSAAPRRRAWLRRASVLSLAAVTLAACAPTAEDSDTTSAGAANTSHTSAWQEKNFSSFYNQEINWRACTTRDGLDSDVRGALRAAKKSAAKYQCATVTAPINWADPTDERTIDLAIVRVPSSAQDGKGKPLFSNPGGPGVGGVSHAMIMPATPGFDAIQKDYELWGFDPRGVGNSSPLECDGKGEAITVQVTDCIQKYPHAQFTGTSHVARDMEMLRALSGAEKLDYHGYSYGTLLGATYATLFSDKAGRMVLDSADDANWASLTSNFDQQVAIARAAGELAKNCKTLKTGNDKPVQCPFTSEREMLDYAKKLDKEPLVTSNGEEFTGSDLKEFITGALYGSPSHYLNMLGQAKAGDQEAIDGLLALIGDEGPSVGAAGILTVCASATKDPDVRKLIEHMKRVGVPEFKGGPKITDEALSDTAQAQLECEAVPSTGTDLKAFDAAQTETPILVVGITGDHATPYEHSAALVEQLGNAVLLTVRGSGHGASFSGRSECTDKAVISYLLEGKVPAAGTTCRMDT